MQITAQVNFHYNYQQCTITPKVNMTETTSQLSHGLLFNKTIRPVFLYFCHCINTCNNVLSFVWVSYCNTTTAAAKSVSIFVYWFQMARLDFTVFFVFWLFCFVLFYSCNIFVNGTCQQTEEKSAFTSNLGEIIMQMIKRGSNHE